MTSEANTNNAENALVDPDDQVLFIRVEFPALEDGPEFKVISLSPNMTVQQAVRHIQDTLDLQKAYHFNLYEPSKKVWWDPATKLKDIPGINTLELVEYRDVKADIGIDKNVSKRRKEKKVSTFVNNWATSFHDQVKKKEEENRRRDQLKKALGSPSELAEIEAKLNDLAKRRPSAIKEQSKTSDDQASEGTFRRLLQERDEKILQAAKAGQQLLRENEELQREMEIWKRRDEMRLEAESANEQLLVENKELASRIRYLESQVKEAEIQNKSLRKTLDVYESNTRSRDGASTVEKDLKIQELNEEVEKLKKLLQQAQESENVVKSQLMKVKLEKTKVEVQLQDATTEYQMKEDEKVTDLRKNIKRLLEENKKLKDKENARGRSGSIRLDNLNPVQMWFKLKRISQSSKFEPLNEDQQLELVRYSERAIGELKSERTPIMDAVFSLMEKVAFENSEKLPEDDTNLTLLENVELNTCLFIAVIVTISWLDKSSTEHRKMIELAKDDKKRLEEDLSELRKNLDDTKRALEKTAQRNQMLEEMAKHLSKSSSEPQSLGDELSQAETLEKWLQTSGLAGIASILRNAGITSMILLKHVDEEDLEGLDLKPFEKRVLLKEVRKLVANPQLHNTVYL